MKQDRSDEFDRNLLRLKTSLGELKEAIAYNPISFWEYRIAHRRNAAFFLIGLCVAPRLTLLYLMFFEKRVFLLLLGNQGHVGSLRAGNLVKEALKADLLRCGILLGVFVILMNSVWWLIDVYICIAIVYQAKCTALSFNGCLRLLQQGFLRLDHGAISPANRRFYKAVVSLTWLPERNPPLSQLPSVTEERSQEEVKVRWTFLKLQVFWYSMEES
eukprot:648446-Hanusia_phi.AAC.4